MGNLSATGEDVKRWRKEKRHDILRLVSVLGPPHDPFGDLWVNDDDGREYFRCPFVRKIPNSQRYRCTIYETRPQVCRDYVPWSGSANDICEQPA
jgi:Fe-S-cluster containining protein